jgi:sRNA-binding protein
MMPLKEEPGTLASAGPLECASTPPARSPNSQNQIANQTVAALARLFPAAFVTDRWAPHKPLKCGIANDLITRGVLLPHECRALGWYTRRRQYQAALAAGGPRYDLDGNVAGAVTPEHAEAAKAALAKLDAKQARRAAQLVLKPKGPAPYHKATPQKSAAQFPRPVDEPPPRPRGLSLDGLRAAARARRAAPSENGR